MKTMHFEILDEHLKIAACTLQKLPAEIAVNLLKQWEPSAPLESLTVFTCTSKKRFGEWNGWAILNKDYADFGKILDIARVILSGATFKNPIPDYQESVDVLESLYEFREKEKLFFQTDNSDFSKDELKLFLMAVGSKQAFEYLDMRRAFAAGIMQGKREERTRKKRQAAESDCLESSIMEMLKKADERQLRLIYVHVKALTGAA